MKIENWKYDCVAHAMNMTLQPQQFSYVRRHFSSTKLKSNSSRFDLYILVEATICSHFNNFFCHHIAFKLTFIWMTLKSFHSNVENWNMTISYRGLKHHFPQCFCTSSTHLTPTYLELWNKSADFLLPVVQCGSWSNHKKWTPNIMCLSI